MKRRIGLVMLACAGVVVFFNGRALSQDEGHEGHEHGDRAPGDTEAMMEMWMKMGAPNEHHKHLQPLVGRFDFVTKWRMSPDAPWAESTGRAENKWILGGRFIAQEIKGDPDENMGGMRFEGFSVMGYDTAKKKHNSFWVDNMGTWFMLSEGTCDDSGKVMTYRSEFSDPLTGQTRKQRSVTTIVNDNKHVFESYDIDEQRKEFKSLEVTYTRR